MLKYKPLYCLALSILLTVSIVSVAQAYKRITPGSRSMREAPLTEIMVNKYPRLYHLYKAKSSDPAPLLVVLHGAKGTVQSVRDLGFEALARKENFSVLYPKAFRGYWMDGRDSLYARNYEDMIDDVLFVQTVIKEMIANGTVDPARVYVTGVSAGGIMAYRLGCELSDMITAIAPVAASLPEGYSCNVDKPLPVLAINGTADALIPWDGGVVGFRNKGQYKLQDREEIQGVVKPVLDTIDFWRDVNKCSSKHIKEKQPVKRRGEQTVVIQHRWEGCEVQLYEVRGGGHTWPGHHSRFLLSRRHITGTVSRQINATLRIWDFFKYQTRKH